MKTSYHPFWRAEGADPEWSGGGMMILGNVTSRRVELTYDPPAWPTWLSLLGWMGVLALCFRGRRFSERTDHSVSE